MDIDTLRELLMKQEGPALEFKWKLPAVYDSDSNVKDRSVGELVKDIISLANGDASVAGQDAYLIVGASDDIDPKSKQRQLRNTRGDHQGKLKKQDIQQWVNNNCSPPLTYFELEFVSLDGCELITITIPPTPHLHILTRDLPVSRGHPVTEQTAVVRRGEHIQPATEEERAAIRHAKTKYFEQSRTVSPVQSAVITSAFITGLLAVSLSKHVVGEENIVLRIIFTLITVLVSSWTSYQVSKFFSLLYSTRLDWGQIRLMGKVGVIAVVVLLLIYTFGAIWLELR